MPISICDNCGSSYLWHWEEAFYKFGFNDGDGQVETWQVESVLSKAGFLVQSYTWGLHNTVITSIQKGGVEYIPSIDSKHNHGYDDPRQYLPETILQLLDDAFNNGDE